MAHKRYITVFGASGRIGSELLKLLSESAIPTLAVSRHRSSRDSLPGVEWVEADMAVPHSLEPVLARSSSIFLLSGQSRELAKEQTNVIRAAGNSSVRHIVKLSSGAAGKESPFYIPGFLIASVHEEVEENLRNSGIPWTILRPNGFMQNWLGEWSRTVQQERKIYDAAGEGKRAYIDIRDIAEVAFTALTTPEKHTGKTHLLTGEEALNYTQIAAILTRALEEEVRFIPLTQEEARLRMEQRGVPPMTIRSLLAYAEAQYQGKATHVSGAVRELLQKPARTVEAFIQDHLGCFR